MTRPGERERRATWLELFFDLVYVAAIAALARQLHDDHSLAGLVVFAGLFVPVWWTWMGFTWYSTTHEGDDAVRRVAFLAGMLAVAVLAAAVPDVADGASAAFVVAFAALYVVLSLLWARLARDRPEARPLAVRYCLGNALGAAIWLASLPVDETNRPWVWALGMIVLILTPIVAVRSTPVRSYDAAHIPERYGLFTIIVLGESIVVAVAGLETGSQLDALTIAGLGFLLAAALWWLYFARMQRTPDAFVAAFTWGYGHFLIFGGIAAASVGIEFCVEAAAEGRPLQLIDRITLSAGLGSFLTALALVRAATLGGDRVVALRLITSTALLAAALIGGLSPLAFTALVSTLFVGAVAIELTLHAPAGGGQLDNADPLGALDEPAAPMPISAP